MKIYGDHKIISLTVVLMTTVIIMGSLCTTGYMKAWGYKELATGWNPISVFVRSYGYVFLLIPFIWGLSALFTQTEREDSDLYEWVACLGGVLLVGLFAFFIYSTFWCMRA